MIFRLVALVLLAGCLGGCLDADFLADDLQAARSAYAERNLPLAERLLERFLREEQDADKRWDAWVLLLKALNANSLEARASLECLEAMRDEYENDAVRQAWILSEMGKYNEAIRHYARAAEAWSAYIDLAEIDEVERVRGLRQLAAAQFAQRHFEAAEATLQECLALPVADSAKVYCMLDLADANMARERWQEVASICQQILDSAPDEQVMGMAGYLRGDALEQMGDAGGALRQFEQARDYYPNPAVMDNRIAHLKQDKSKKETK